MSKKNRSASRNRERLISVAEFFRKAPIARFGSMAVLSMIIAITISPYLSRSVTNYKQGQFTTSAVRAPYSFSVDDEAATKRKRVEAANQVTPVANLDARLPRDLKKRAGDAFASLLQWTSEAETQRNVPEDQLKNLSSRRQKALLQQAEKKAEALLGQKMTEEFPTVEKALGIQLTGLQKTLLKKSGAVKEVIDGIGALIDDAYARPVIQDSRSFLREVEGNAEKKDGPARLVVKDLLTGKETVISDLSSLREPKQIEATLEERATVLLPKMKPEGRALVVNITRTMVSPNLVLAAEETHARRKAAAEAVIPVSYIYKKNQLILGEGEEVTEQKHLVLRYLRMQKRSELFLSQLLKSAFLFFLLILLGFWIADVNIKQFVLRDRDFFFLASTLVVSLLMLRIWLFIVAETVAFRPEIPQMALILVFPVGLVAMTTRYLLNFEVAIVQGAIISFLYGILSHLGLPFAIYTFIVGLIAAHQVAGCGRRSALLKAGLWTGLASAVVAICLPVLSEEPSGLYGLLVPLGAVLGGVLAGFGVVAISPLAEWLFGYSTDITLLEQSNYEHPLLKKILFETPGTFQHSLNIGILAEQAAESVGANPLLVRIGSLFHDAGKSANPLFFVENQKGKNPHDELDPVESASIIRSHVTDGVKLVRTYGLNERIADFVREHHGTGSIKYFLDKAQKQGGQVDLDNFYYPGPKPRSKETGILMIADQVEATSRTMEDKSTDGFRAMVRRTIARIHDEGQLDECPLTLQDLAKIQEAFVQVLSGIHHHRIKYPSDKR